MRALYTLEAASLEELRTELGCDKPISTLNSQLKTMELKRLVQREKRGRLFVYSPYIDCQVLIKSYAVTIAGSVGKLRNRLIAELIKQKPLLGSKSFEMIEGAIAKARAERKENLRAARAKGSTSS